MTARSRAGARIPVRRKFDFMALVSFAQRVGGILILACTAQASPEIDWATDVPQAIANAKQSGELIMVCDLPTAATVDDPTSLANDAFLVGTVGSRRLTRILQRECIPVRRLVGVPPFVHVQKKENRVPPAPQACPVTYFCVGDFKTGNIQPQDLVVAHFVVGYVAADRLEKETQWALENHRKARYEVVGDNEASTSLSKWLQIAHLDASSATDISTIKTSTNLLRNRSNAS